jgi:hypothetical protein
MCNKRKFDLIQFDLIQFDLIQFDLIQFDLIQFDLIERMEGGGLREWLGVGTWRDGEGLRRYRLVSETGTRVETGSYTDGNGREQLWEYEVQLEIR